MVQNTVISYPIPPYQNLPIRADFYVPKRYVISAISLGVLTTITTSVAHDYVIGQLIRLLIPPKFGSRGLNNREAYVTSIPSSTQVVIDLDSNYADPFIPNPTFVTFEPRTQPQIIPLGDINEGAINSTGRINLSTFIPGSFINISPL